MFIKLYSYILIFLGMIAIKEKIFLSGFNLKEKIFILVTLFALIAPAMTTIPFSVEPRYQMPELLVLYAFGIFNINKRYDFKLIFKLVVFILFCFLLRSNTYMSLPGTSMI
ncbi:MAG: hypothetical protein LW807_06815 [Proteobacteria bacterium]|nr:hypothetical protein [Pseudomonadota bacterium]